MKKIILLTLVMSLVFIPGAFAQSLFTESGATQFILTGVSIVVAIVVLKELGQRFLFGKKK